VSLTRPDKVIYHAYLSIAQHAKLKEADYCLEGLKKQGDPYLQGLLSIRIIISRCDATLFLA
jgi:hypothetical protein